MFIRKRYLREIYHAHQSQHPLICVYGAIGNDHESIGAMYHQLSYYIALDFHIYRRPRISPLDHTRSHYETAMNITTTPDTHPLIWCQGYTHHESVLSDYLNKKRSYSLLIVGDMAPSPLLTQQGAYYIRVRPLGFWEYIQYRGYHIHHFPIDTVYTSISSKIQGHLHEYRDWGGYLRICSLQHPQQRYEALHQLIVTAWDLAPSPLSQWGKEQYLTLLRVVVSHCGKPRSRRAIARLSQIPIRHIDTYINYWISVGYIAFVAVCTSTSTRQRLSYLILHDLGLQQFAYYPTIPHTTSSLSHHHQFQRLASECLKLPHTTRTTWHKHNGSRIDLLGVCRGVRIAIMIGHRNTTSIPKIAHSTQELRDIAIKTTTSITTRQSFGDKTIRCMPYYMVSRYLFETFHRGTIRTENHGFEQALLTLRNKNIKKQKPR